MKKYNGQSTFHFEAEEAASRGMQRAAKKSGDVWVTYAVGFITKHLGEHSTMHCDDLWEAGMKIPKSPRALGVAMRQCAKLGIMSEQVVNGGIVARRSTTSNNQLKRVWKSEIYTGTKKQKV